MQSVVTHHVEVTLLAVLRHDLLPPGHLLPLLGLGGHGGGGELLLAVVQAAHLLAQHLLPLLAVHLLPGLLLETFLSLMYNVLITEG